MPLTTDPPAPGPNRLTAIGARRGHPGRSDRASTRTGTRGAYPAS